MRCVPDLASLPEPLDLFIVAIGAQHVPNLVDEIIERHAAHSIMLIPGGLGETEESKGMAARMMRILRKATAGETAAPYFSARTAWA